MGKKKTKQTPKRSTFLYPHLYRARRLRKRNLPADGCLRKARGSFEVRKGHSPGLMSGERPEVDRIRSEFRGFALCHEVLESGSGIRAVVTVSLRNGAQKSLGGLDARRARPGPEQAAVSHTLPATRSVPPTCGIARGNGRWLWFALQLSLGTQVRARLSLVFTFCVGRRSGLGPEKEGPRDCGDLCSGRTRSLLGEDAPRSRALRGSGRIAVRFPA